MLNTTYTITTEYTAHETQSDSHAFKATIEDRSSSASRYGATEADAILSAFETFDGMREHNEGTLNERLDREAVELFDERTQEFADKLADLGPSGDGLVREIADEHGHLVGRLHLDDSDCTYRAELVVGELTAMLDGAHIRKAGALHELARAFLIEYDRTTRGVVCVGRDGASKPMYRYRDELHLPEHMRTVAPAPVLKS